MKRLCDRRIDTATATQGVRAHKHTFRPRPSPRPPGHRLLKVKDEELDKPAKVATKKGEKDGEGTTKLYGEWQTKPWVPEAAVNGKVRYSVLTRSSKECFRWWGRDSVDLLRREKVEGGHGVGMLCACCGEGVQIASEATDPVLSAVQVCPPVIVLVFLFGFLHTPTRALTLWVMHKGQGFLVSEPHPLPDPHGTPYVGPQERIRQRGVLRLQPGTATARDQAHARRPDRAGGGETGGGLRPRSDRV